VPYVALTDQALVVQNPLSRTVVPYAAIVQVKAGYYGVRIRRHDGTSVAIWAIQKSNAASLTKKHTRADEVVEAIQNHTSPNP
jgi:hypothetical protein